MPDPDIYSAAVSMLGRPEKIDRRGWATWWCPFHDDRGRHGKSKRPNFGVNLDSGNWKCLRCGRSGGSIHSLHKALGLRPPDRPPPAMPVPEEEPNYIPHIGQALSVARSNLRGSAAWKYIVKRGVSPQVAAVYGLGVGPGRLSKVSPETVKAALKAGLVSAKTGWWLWDKAVVYADPPVNPDVVQVRHLRRNAYARYQTWGRQLRPYGAWRIGSQTRVVVSVEGMFDMLVLASVIAKRGLSKQVIPVYTGGATPAEDILRWYERAGKYRHVLIPDADKAGMAWMDTLSKCLYEAKAESAVVFPPGGVDPDEAVLAGWWPKEIGL